MLYIGFDGIGYQTGLATSHDLVIWKREALVAPRDPASQVHKIQPRPQLHPPRQRPPLTRRSHQDQRPLPRRMERLPQRRLRRGRSRHRSRLVARSPPLGAHRPHPLPAGRRTLGARRPLPPRPAPTRRHLLPLLQRQDRHPPQIRRRRLARAIRRSHLARSQDLDALPRQSHPPHRPARLHATHASPPTPTSSRNGREWAMFYFGLGYQRPGRACEMIALGPDPFHFTKVTRDTHRHRRPRHHRRDLRPQALRHLSRRRALPLLLRRLRQMARRDTRHRRSPLQTLVATPLLRPHHKPMRTRTNQKIAPHQPRIIQRLTPHRQHHRSRRIRRNVHRHSYIVVFTPPLRAHLPQAQSHTNPSPNPTQPPSPDES